MAAKDETVVGFKRRDAARISRVVRAHEGGGSADFSRSPGSQPWTFSLVRARVTTAIPAGTTAAPSSSGRAQIYHRDASGAWVASGDPVQVWNDHAYCPGVTSIAVGKAAKLGWINGQWWLVGADA